MKIHEMTNLFIAYNEEAEFTILVYAMDKEEAIEIATEYRDDTNLGGHFEILEDANLQNARFDCDYVVK